VESGALKISFLRSESLLLVLYTER